MPFYRSFQTAPTTPRAENDTTGNSQISQKQAQGSRPDTPVPSATANPPAAEKTAESQNSSATPNFPAAEKAAENQKSSAMPGFPELPGIFTTPEEDEPATPAAPRASEPADAFQAPYGYDAPETLANPITSEPADAFQAPYGYDAPETLANLENSDLSGNAFQTTYGYNTPKTFANPNTSEPADDIQAPYGYDAPEDFTTSDSLEPPTTRQQAEPSPSRDTLTRPLYPVDNSTESFGGLRVNITNISSHLPVEDAVVRITAEDGTTPGIMEELRTDATGQTGVIELPAPPRAYSEEAGSPRPYGKYTIDVTARGYEPFHITGTEVLPTVVSLQAVQLLPMSETPPNSAETFVIPEHTLYGTYPPKIAEEEVKEVSGSGEIVLSEVVIPEFIVVHDGTITNKSAQNYYVRYRDYIKNVASSEIYATWPEATIYANVLAIQSFTLNRVYTEWYRNRGYDYTITSSTAYDHKWIPDRNIFDTISTAVDNIFNNYLSRPNIIQPILAQYCDGKRTKCPGLMSQWGSKYLGDEGYSAIEILRNYYGSSIFINTTEQISGVPSSYPGEPLTSGSRGEAVRQMQEQLNAIANVYYSIPNLAADGIFGPATKASVSAFQKQFNLSPTGTVDFSTWYKISEIYVAITKIAEYTK